MKKLFLLTILLMSINVHAQSIRERLDDIEDKLDSLILQRQYDEVDKLIEGNRRLRENSPPREIEILLSKSSCNVGLVDYKFQKFTPQLELINPTLKWIGWTAFSFSRTNSLVFLENTMLGGLSEAEKMRFARTMITKHLNTIRKLCPNIPPDLIK